MGKNGIYILSGVAILVIIAVFVLNMPDNRSGPQRIGDAVETLPKGVDKAGDQLKDRNPVEKAGDAIDKKTN